MADDSRGRAETAREGARLLRQRAELGAGELFLEGLTKDEALALARAAAKLRAGRAAGGAGAARTPGVERSAVRGGTRATGVTPAGPTRPPASPEPTAGAGIRPPGDGGAAGSGEPPTELPDTHEALKALALGCTRCRLADGRTQVVFADGPADARLMVVGEAPGAHEDETGLPFVGAAGKLLDLLLATVDLSRAESVYICNVLKCRPPGNRNPMPDEIDLCSPFLKRQIDLVRPEALLAVGTFSGRLLTGQEKSSLKSLRGRVHAYHGVPLVVTYHPAALLRNSGWTRLFWDDLQLLRSLLDGRTGGAQTPRPTSRA